jgi:hypothetical protein
MVGADFRPLEAFADTLGLAGRPQEPAQATLQILGAQASPAVILGTFGVVSGSCSAVRERSAGLNSLPPDG